MTEDEAIDKIREYNELDPTFPFDYSQDEGLI